MSLSYKVNPTPSDNRAFHKKNLKKKRNIVINSSIDN